MVNGDFNCGFICDHVDCHRCWGINNNIKRGIISIGNKNITSIANKNSINISRSIVNEDIIKNIISIIMTSIIESDEIKG